MWFQPSPEAGNFAAVAFNAWKSAGYLSSNTSLTLNKGYIGLGAILHHTLTAHLMFIEADRGGHDLISCCAILGVNTRVLAIFSCLLVISAYSTSSTGEGPVPVQSLHFYPLGRTSHLLC